MSTENNRSLDGFVESLEKRARVARTISITITLATIVVGALALYFTIRQIKLRIDQETDTLAHLTQERIEAEKKLDSAKQDLEVIQQKLAVYRSAVAQLPEEKRETLLKNAEKQVDLTPPTSPKIYLQILDNDQR